MYDALFESLTPDCVVLTPSHRLTLFLQRQYQRYQAQRNQAVWVTPNILPLDTWIEQCWQRGALAGHYPTPFLLNEYQTSLLWERIIQQSPYGENLLHPGDAAALVSGAWQLTQDWQLDLRASEFNLTPNTVAFRHFAQQFQMQCRDQTWIDKNSLMIAVIEAIQKKSIPLPQHIILVGFLEFSPRLQKLFECISTQGHPIKIWKTVSINQDRHAVALSDPETELITMARFATNLLQDNEIHSMGCVIPGLADMRNHVEDIFAHVIQHHPYSDVRNRYEQPFNISMGLPFSNYPLIVTALQTLSLLQAHIPLVTLSSLLRSPFLAHAESEMCARAAWDTKLREFSCPDFTLKFLTQQTPVGCAALMKRLQQLLDHQPKISSSQLPSAFANHFVEQLHCLGWPGERTLNSVEFQLHQRWEELLIEFSKLDALLGQIHYEKALHYLHRLANNISFQPKSKEAPIQILGTLEATGMSFDRLWIMGLHDAVWPPSPQPNPFIPLIFQRQLEMPHATTEREYYFSEQLTEQLCHSATRVILSYPLRDNEQERRPSPYLHTLPLLQISDLHLPALADDEKTTAEKTCEWIEDDIGPAMTSKEIIKGGTAILKNQAACPFRAFSYYRLGIKSFRDPQLGLNAMQRGNLAHEILQIVWQQLKNHETLCSYSEPDLQKLIDACITTAFNQFEKTRPDLLAPRFKKLEQQRLHQLVSQWLDLEKIREKFTVVATEQQYSYTLAGLTLQAQVDRIDQLSDGSQLIIDYKTGKCSVEAWQGDRPDEPQLPFYCISSAHPISGLAFAQLQAHKLQWKGFMDQRKNAGNMGLNAITDWPTYVTEWQQVLENLAQQFQSGHAEVDPKHPIQTCQFCDLSSLCRVTTHSLSPTESPST